MADIIKFNVGQRGRTHRGTERNFDTRALAALVNSPATQERVNNRDMLGYYGHWQRMKFGLIPPETVVAGGKIINIEPAIVTTYLRADPDGTIEHKTEFLETAAGKIAARLHASRTGGYSSAIHANPRNGLDVATVFAGFDYVLEPNFTSNRGYTFDSIMGVDAADEGMIFDFVMQDFSRNNTAMLALYDSLQGDHALALATIQQLQEENEDLLSALARGGNTVLDSAGGSRPMLMSKQATQAFAARAEGFRGARLHGFQSLPVEGGGDDALMDRAKQQWGIK